MRRATPDHSPDAVARRSFLRRGAVVGGAAALGAGLHATAAAAQVSAQAVDYVYLPIGPARVYDSRNGSGPLFLGQTRQLLTGLQDADPPPIAVTVNLTVTQTAGKGWLAIYPGDVAFGGTSSINWFGDQQDLANNAFVGVPDDGAVDVSAGGTGGSGTQFVIDLIGASVGVDFSSPPLASATAVRDALASLRAPWSEA